MENKNNGMIKIRFKIPEELRQEKKRLIIFYENTIL